jgi:hypothetical protein
MRPACQDDQAGPFKEKLGEPASLLRQFNAPLDVAASASVEALQAYAAGAATYGKLEAVSHFMRAAELDPGFALAYEWLARCYEGRIAHSSTFIAERTLGIAMLVQ